MSTIGRNDPCHCGSGKKYKKCHLEADEKAGRKEREKAALNAAKVASDAQKDESAAPAKHPTGHKQEGWMQKVAGKVGFFKASKQQRPLNKGG